MAKELKIGDMVKIHGRWCGKVTYVRYFDDEPPKFKVRTFDESPPKFWNRKSLRKVKAKQCRRKR